MPWWAANTDATKRYHRMAGWYNSPECDALRAAWGAYPASPETLESWPGFVAVTNAFLDHGGPPAAPAVASERTAGEEEQQAPSSMEGEREAPALSEEAAAEEPYAEVPGEAGVVEGVVVEEGPALSNKTLRDWVRRWCDGNREGLPPISTWNTSRVTDMNYLFRDQRNFNDDVVRGTHRM